MSLLPAVTVRGLSARFCAIRAEHVECIVGVEQSAYGHPWGRRHFLDSVDSGHLMQALLLPAPDSAAGPRWDTQHLLLGYLVAMHAADEMHLLNLTVAPSHQRQGWGAAMLASLIAQARALRACDLWLEVRASNHGARALYERQGLALVGRRRDYYPDTAGRREDALVMGLRLDIPHAAAPDAATQPRMQA